MYNTYIKSPFESNLPEVISVVQQELSLFHCHAWDRLHKPFRYETSVADLVQHVQERKFNLSNLRLLFIDSTMLPPFVEAFENFSGLHAPSLDWATVPVVVGLHFNKDTPVSERMSIYSLEASKKLNIVAIVPPDAQTEVTTFRILSRALTYVDRKYNTVDAKNFGAALQILAPAIKQVRRRKDPEMQPGKWVYRPPAPTSDTTPPEVKPA